MEVIEVLEGSVRKWALIAHGLGVDEGKNNCALCREFSCRDCPVSDVTGYGGCLLTPYEAWLDHHEYDHPRDEFPLSLQCPTCRELAQWELMYLQGILEEHLAAAKEARNESH